MCKNNYPYLPWLWVGLVDQKSEIVNILQKVDTGQVFRNPHSKSFPWKIGKFTSHSAIPKNPFVAGQALFVSWFSWLTKALEMLCHLTLFQSPFGMYKTLIILFHNFSPISNVKCQVLRHFDVLNHTWNLVVALHTYVLPEGFMLIREP